MRRALLARSDAFVNALTEKLLTYALGRELDYYDEPAVRAIVRDAAPQGTTLVALIQAIVASDPFQKRVKLGAAVQRRAGAGVGRRRRQRRGVDLGATRCATSRKKHLSRRTVLRGAGAALALPFLESMIPGRHTQRPRRPVRRARGSPVSTCRTAA